jgi:uncharacterized protein (TIGR02145 family)
MKIIFIPILFAVFAVQLHAQIRQGVVLDANTHKPVVDANIFINGTTIGTSSNEYGMFSLQRFPKPPYQIHISAIGYETKMFEILEKSDNDLAIILLEPQTSELTGVAVRRRRIRISGCNSNVPGWGTAGLGTIDHGGEITITNGYITQTWSYPVTASNCQKSTFDGGSQTDYNADCRSNPEGYRGDFFSWCAVKRFENTLCPYPWRVPTDKDFANLSQALCGNWHGTYHVLRENRRDCHTQFLTTWSGLHHGFSDPTGKVYEQGRLVYYWEYLEYDDYCNNDRQVFSPAYKSNNAVHYWGRESLESREWKVTALDKVHNKDEVAHSLMNDTPLSQFIENHRESNAVYYWSQSTHGVWQAFALGLSADRDPTYNVSRERNRDRHRWGYYVVLPQLSIDKNFGLTLRCVKD